VGSREAMGRAHRYRKMMGGGMRQAGILAAAGLVALDEGPALLHHDHRRARALAETLAGAGYGVDLSTVQTNMIYVTLPDAAAQAERWGQAGLLCNALDHDKVRFVLHRDIDDEALARAQAIIQG
jgi:threonine aldolase